MDDLEAVRRLKHGDIGGLELLIARYQAKAVRTAYLVTCDAQAAEEVVQEAFIRFYERARQFDESRAFEPYFLRMVVHAALNQVEHESHATLSLDEDAGLYKIERLLASASPVEDQVEYEQLKHAIHTAIGALSPRLRAVAVQRYYLEMSETEMSAALDVAPGTVKWLLHTARSRLRTLLGWQRSEE
ncbi:MAG: sigma-70 family RNA polymerase sigma factor [Chloroflexi bacterium]|nr:sigma-70 family RNA polymerase sigma factor [Anaerolineaceae bacterium]NMB88244.1 sigma-70 family RNA polymerase sigma factor [Chloroflexota bacterium]